MQFDNENTNRDTEMRSPFLDAYLQFDRQVFKAIELRGGLLCTLGVWILDREHVQDHADRVITAWEAAERAVDLMAAAKQHQELALSAQAACLLDQNGELTADVLERAAHRLADDALLARAGQLRERARLRREHAACEQSAYGQART